MSSTHTFVTLAVSHDAHYEIAEALRAAQYDHVFQEDPELPGRQLIDMNGIALRDTVSSHSASGGQVVPDPATPAITDVKLTLAAAIKIGSAIVHADEHGSVQGRTVDWETFKGLLRDPEVAAFLNALDRAQFLPLRRDGVRYRIEVAGT